MTRDARRVAEAGQAEAPGSTALVRVRYACGRVPSLAAYRRGAVLRGRTWTAPRIPRAVRELIERKGLMDLAGEWGDPRSASPIEVAVIDIETASDIISIEAFNIDESVVASPGADLWRVHRTCRSFERMLRG